VFLAERVQGRGTGDRCLVPFSLVGFLMGFKRDEVDWVSITIHLAIRSRGRCEFCGVMLPTNHGVRHHRKLRSRGGGHELENLALVSSSCHSYAHANPAIAMAHGWIVRGESDPSEVPMIQCRSAMTVGCNHEEHL